MTRPHILITPPKLAFGSLQRTLLFRGKRNRRRRRRGCLDGPPLHGGRSGSGGLGLTCAAAAGYLAIANDNSVSDWFFHSPEINISAHNFSLSTCLKDAGSVNRGRIFLKIACSKQLHFSYRCFCIKSLIHPSDIDLTTNLYYQRKNHR